jgi:hypothetical protein
MKVNVKKLDDTIAKLMELRRLATDPALSSFVTVTGRTNGATPSANSPSSENGNNHGTLKPSVLAACKTFIDVYTIHMVYDKMKEQGHQFNSDSAQKSVSNAIRALANGGEIVVAEAGSGRRATTYRNP